MNGIILLVSQTFLFPRSIVFFKLFSLNENFSYISLSVSVTWLLNQLLSLRINICFVSFFAICGPVLFHPRHPKKKNRKLLPSVFRLQWKMFSIWTCYCHAIYCIVFIHVLVLVLTCVCDKQMHSVGHDFDDVSVSCEFHKHPTVVIAMMSSQVLYISRYLTQKSFQLQYNEGIHCKR